MSANKQRIYEDVAFLTSISPARNYQHIASLEKACNYIQTEFLKLGATSELQTWQANGHEYKNVIASFHQHKKKRLIVGAHYDACGDQPGADDNASAVAGLLETARLVFASDPPIDYRIDFVAYSLEEPPFFGTHSMGSYVHAKSLYENNCDVIGMICYEMIGYFSDLPESQPFPSPELAKLYPHVADFIMVVGIERCAGFNKKVYRLMAEDAGIDVQMISFPTGDALAGLAGLSDQRNYWQFGYDALMINDTSFVRNPNYHTKKDTIDTLDFDKLTEVVNCAYKAVTNIL
jgi:Zn-dependent M28 family amino/carboxypeptidase